MKFENIASRLEFELNEGVYTYVKDGYAIYLKNWQYLLMNIPSLYIPVKGKLKDKFAKRVEQAALNNACSIEKINDEMMYVIVTLPDGNKNSDAWFEKIKQIIDRVIKLLAIEELLPLNVCPICNKESERHSFMKNYIPMHQHCHLQYYLSLKEQTIHENSALNGLIVILLSIVFAIIGLVPSFLFAYYSFDYFTPLIAFCPLGVVLANVIVKKSTNKWVKIICCFIPIVLILIFNFFSLQYMPKMMDIRLSEYFFSGKFVGLRKIIISTLLSFSAFGFMKLINKINPDKKQLIYSLENDEIFIKKS